MARTPIIKKMACPHCYQLAEARVVDIRPAADGQWVRRRRHCELCGSRFTTHEIVVAERVGAPQPHKKGGTLANIGAGLTLREEI